ncbi:hypothetical protein [Qipengyuania marisflavi]|uniref:Uncharacterized protein n=1 Tax=Qipengyuania marisflavi TaxID=2486356 RepID=A0A5S3PC31_9SPHN|nr:hypothetical protein [Qipengyuania marisflavi]TMM48799.1 hypothetical protein FEV51_05230 [Qipengyuania marisflavi]
MIAAGSRLRQIGWALVLGLCFAALLALTFKVNAVKSEVRLTERHIIAAEQSRIMLETEFQTRSNQKQLAAWNAVEFGYGAPRADQYLENERQLASLGTPRGSGAPQQVRVALNRPVEDAEDSSMIADWLAGEDDAPDSEAPPPAPRRELVANSIAQRLARPAGSMAGSAEVQQ